MKSTRKPKSQRAGFTLVEMLIVLGILVALFAMVLPRFLGSQKKAKIDLAKTQIGSFRSALERYYLDCDRFPTTEQGLQALAAQPADLGENTAWHGPYVTGDIAADPWGSPYQYESPPTHSNGDTPDLWSYGPDAEDGTDDDVCSWTAGSSASGGDATADDVNARPTAGTKASPKAGAGGRPKAGSPPKAPRATAPKPIRSENP